MSHLSYLSDFQISQCHSSVFDSIMNFYELTSAKYCILLLYCHDLFCFLCNCSVNISNVFVCQFLNLSLQIFDLVLRYIRLLYPFSLKHRLHHDGCYEQQLWQPRLFSLHLWQDLYVSPLSAPGIPDEYIFHRLSD